MNELYLSSTYQRIMIKYLLLLNFKLGSNKTQAFLVAEFHFTITIKPVSTYIQTKTETYHFFLVGNRTSFECRELKYTFASRYDHHLLLFHIMSHPRHKSTVIRPVPPNKSEGVVQFRITSNFHNFPAKPFHQWQAWSRPLSTFCVFVSIQWIDKMDKMTSIWHAQGCSVQPLSKI